ncbi:MAG: hypothetical protein [Olavius algarvensis Gamma 1 endosymbiont]|nr:MAG: hypothetical protein [Olavius algarvensis Gamma 1 endosymbiont]
MRAKCPRSQYESRQSHESGEDSSGAARQGSAKREAGSPR